MIATTAQQWFASSTPPGQWPFSAAVPGPSPALARIPVLVLEDEAMIAWMLESMLEDMGFETITLASSATEAAAAAEQRTPELIISDINLGPGADGIEAVAAICQKCSPSVVFVSAFIDESARSRISDQIAHAHFLSKPLIGDGLAAVIRNALSLNRAS